MSDIAKEARKEVAVDFSFFSDEANKSKLTAAIPSNLPAVQPDGTVTVSAKKTVRKKKDETTDEETTSVLGAYEDNMNALKKTVMEYDILAAEFKADLDYIRGSRTLKGKFHYSAEIGQTLNSILSNKVAAIKELNATVKTAKEYDYKVAKDRQAALEGNDDKRIMDMYNAFIGSPVSAGNRNVLGPTDYQMTLINQVPQYMGEDAGYSNYIQNLTPEQNMMLFETNPDIKQVVTYNQSTGEKHFQVMNVKTGEVIPNAAHHDDMFLEGVTIDPRRKIARNTNINESYPLIVYNDESKTNGF